MFETILDLYVHVCRPEGPARPGQSAPPDRPIISALAISLNASTSSLE